jgi:HTH-type transcriptional regulator/antitoxin HigA
MGMDIRPIHNEDDYAWAMAEVSRYFENEPEFGSEDGNRFEVLLTLIGAYEVDRYPISTPDPIEMLEFAISSMGHTRAELSNLLGSRSRVSEILNRKRPLTLDQIRTISEAWKLPVDVLAKPYRLEKQAA